MKKILFLLALFTGLWQTYAQKELQPYKYTEGKDTEGKDIDKSFFIYAVANAPNSIKFTMKDDMGEVFKVKSDSLFNKKLKGENLEFTVFPFSEIEFKAKLMVAVEEINKTTLKDKFEFDTEKIKKAADNIFQFFNALVTTAFEYDNEPVAGKLVYNMDKITVTKNILQGTIDTEHYFKRHTKKLKEYLYLNKRIPHVNKKRLDRKKEGLKSDFFSWLMRFENSNKNLSKEDPKGDLGKGNSSVKQNPLEKYKEYVSILNYWSLGNFRMGRRKFKKYGKENLPLDYQQFYFSFNDSLSPLSEFMKNYKELRKKSDCFLDSIAILEKERESLESNKIDSTTLKNINDKIKLYQHLNQTNDTLVEKYKRSKERIEEKKLKLSAEIETLKSNNEKNDSIKKALDKDILKLTEDISKLTEDISKLTEDIKNNKENIENTTPLLNKEKKILEGKRNERNDSIKIYNSKIEKLKEELKPREHEISNLIFKNKQLLLNLPLWKFKIEGIEIDINDGYFEHITMTGKLLGPDLTDIRKSEDIIDQLYNEEATKEIISSAIGKSLKFENEFPIGFSSKADYADMYDYKLYHFEGGDKIFSMALSADLLTYIPRHQNDRLNFSPKDQVVTLPTQNETESGAIELKKQESAKILHARFYTDFIGFKENEENSPAQIEIGKQVPIWTKRYNLGIGRSSNFGLIDYMDFNLTWAKLTEEDAELEVSKAPYYINGEEKFDDYVTYLDIVSHENLSVGVDLNVFSIDFPLIKTRFDFNAGAHYGRVNVVKKTSIEEGEQQEVTVVTSNDNTNIIRYYPEVKTWIRPDERFGGNINWRPFKLVVPKTEKFRAVSSENLFLSERVSKKKWLQRFELSTFFTPSPNSDNRFFFRYRYTNSLNFEYNGYSEVQVGYLYYLKF